MENQDQIAQKEQQQKELQSSIMLSLDLENAFKMYSYRIISTDAYIERVSELVETYNARLS